MTESKGIERNPMRDRQVEALFALLSGPSYGYDIGRRIEAITGADRLSLSGIYSSLGLLTEKNLVERIGPFDSDEGPQRFYYTLTPTGMEVVILQANYMASLLQHAVPFFPDQDFSANPGQNSNEQ